MKPRRTVRSNFVFVLPEGNEDNDLWAEVTQDEEEYPTIRTTWVPTPEEREAIAAGANIQVEIWGKQHPAMAVGINDDPLGKPPSVDEEGS